MFTYVKIKNYKSLSEVKFNLTNNKKAKKLAIVYGENGAGKSNLVNVFYTLIETLWTMRFRKIVLDYLKVNESEKKSSKKIWDIMQECSTGYKDIEVIINSVKTINSEEPVKLEYGFQIEDSVGNYILEMNKDKIIYEELNFKLNKKKSYVYKITNHEIKINPKGFINKEYYKEITELVTKFWGKHSLLAILLSEIDDKTEDYIKKSLNENFLKVLNFFDNFQCMVKDNNLMRPVIFKNFKNLRADTIKISEENDLNKIEELLNEFFTQLYSDIKQVYYEKERTESEIKYKLYVKKLIGGTIRDVDFDLESSGTQNLLELIPFILEAASGKVVIIDEFGTGIHDLLIKQLIVNLEEYITGQLIITTHNTMIMDSDIDKKALYVINSNIKGQKEINCISDIEERLHPNLNIRSRYLSGLYDGTPMPSDIDFEELLDILED